MKQFLRMKGKQLTTIWEISKMGLTACIRYVLRLFILSVNNFRILPMVHNLATVNFPSVKTEMIYFRGDLFPRVIFANTTKIDYMRK